MAGKQRETGMDLKSQRPKRSLWRRVVDFALTDVNTLVEGGLDEAAVERFEQVLIEADFGIDVTMELVGELERAVERGKIKSEADLRELLRSRICALLSTAGPTTGPTSGPVGPVADSLERGERLGVVLVLGVNGVGKTTTVAKLAHALRSAGNEVLVRARSSS